MGSCSTLNDLSNKVIVSNKRADLNLSIFNMIIKINESKIPAKHMSCECKFKFDDRKCTSNQKWNNEKCWCECQNSKEHNAWRKYHIWNPTTCNCKCILYFSNNFSSSTWKYINLLFLSSSPSLILVKMILHFYNSFSSSVRKGINLLFLFLSISLTENALTCPPI